MSRITHWLLLFLLLVILLVPHSLSARPGEFDHLIKKSAETWLPVIDWRLWKAQVEAESAFRVNARSPVGAMGLSQIMPATFADIGKQSGISGNPYDPETNLMAGAWYMRRMRGVFTAPRPEAEKHNLAVASYNAGAGNIIKAQALAGNPQNWQPVADILHLVTGKHATETTGYVTKIRANYRRYLLAGE